MIAPLARLGYASKAVIYAVIGVLAITAALNRGGRVTDTSGALRVVLSQPYGRALLLVLAIGLLGYALWRTLDAVMDPDRHGTDAKGIVERISIVIRGLIYGGVGVEALRLFRGLGSSSSSDADAKAWAARILEWPLGEFLLMAIGGIIALYGAKELIGTLKGKDDPKVDYSRLPREAGPSLRKISRFGVGARGLIIATIGGVLVGAAIRHDPGQAAGQRESILELAGAVEGRWLLAIIAAGLLAYAVDQAVHAYCRRMRPVI